MFRLVLSSLWRSELMFRLVMSCFANCVPLLDVTLNACIQVTQVSNELRLKLKSQVQRVDEAKVSDNVLEIVQKILAA